MLLTLLLTSVAHAATVSEQYSHLNAPSLQRSQILSEANDRLNKSYNFGAFQNTLRILFPNYNGSTPKFTEGPGNTLILTERGLGLQGDKVSVVSSFGEAKVIFDTAKLPGFERFRVVQSFPSAQLDHMAIVLSENQSSVFYKLAIYHFESGRTTLFKGRIFAHLTAAGVAPQWNSDSEFVFIEALNDPGKIRRNHYNVDTGQSSIEALALGAPAPKITPNSPQPDAPPAIEVDIQIGLGEFLAEDGVKITATILYKKDIQWTGNNAVLISSYGGFNNLNGPPSTVVQNSMEKDFILRNGVIVYPILRGDKGATDDWYRSAMGAHRKKRTFLDLIAVAKGLVDQQFTTPRNIISTGASNGGLTAAAAALLSPESFGLIIPQSAPLDILDIAELDPWVWQGWSFDYGNAQSPEDLPFILQYSPVEMAKNQKNLTFLITSGEQDDVVNVAHSIKLYSALRERGGAPDKVHLLTTKYGGHNIGSGRDIGDLLYNGRMWTFIYNYLGWTR